ncbi:MAG: DUF4410 domain-containing protein, partial [bacterium]
MTVTAKRLRKLGTAVLLGLPLAGCAPTTVVMEREATGPLPRPTLVLVYDFAVSLDDVKLDRGLIAQLQNQGQPVQPRQAELAVGKAAREALAQALVEQLRALGLPVARATGEAVANQAVLELRGQFLTIDEGNRTRRVMIGFGVGHSDVQTAVQLYETLPRGRTLIARFTTDARSGPKPGAAATMGAGAVADQLAESDAVSGGLAVVSETLSATVVADAKRTAKELVGGQLGQFVVM